MNNQNDEIDLLQILYLFSKFKKRLINCLLIGAAIGTLFMGIDYFKNQNDPKYVITSSFAIVTTNSTGKYISNTTNPGYNDIKLAEDIAESVVFVTKSDRVLTSAIKKMHFLGIRAEDIKKNLTVNQYGDTQIITLKLRWNNASEGLDIIQSICDVVPNILIDTLNLGSVSVVDFPENEGLEATRLHIEYVLLGSLGLAGLFIGIKSLQSIIHPTVSNLSTVEKDLDGIECFGILPDDENYFVTRPYSLSLEDNIDHYEIKEALNSTAHLLRTVIINEGHKCLYFTSSFAAEGKTGIVANIAIELSKQGMKTLVVDMDVRKPTLASCFTKHVAHEKSLNAIYDGTSEVENVLLTVAENLDVLPARLEKDRVRVDKVLTAKIKKVFDNYDVVLLDTAPIGLVSDVVLLNDLADRAVMVIRYDTVWIETVRQNIEKLRKSGIETCGTIIANVQNYIGTGYSSYHNSYANFYSSYHAGAKEEKTLFRKNKDRTVNKSK